MSTAIVIIREREEDRKEGRKEGGEGERKKGRERKRERKKKRLPDVNFPTFQAGQTDACFHSDLHRPLGVCHIESVTMVSSREHAWV